MTNGPNTDRLERALRLQLEGLDVVLEELRSTLTVALATQALQALRTGDLELQLTLSCNGDSRYRLTASAANEAAVVLVEYSLPAHPTGGLQ